MSVLAPNIGNIVPSGIREWWFIDSGDSDWGVLKTGIRNSSVSFKAITKSDTLKRDATRAYELSAKADFPCPHTYANLINLLPTLANDSVLLQSLLLVNGQFLSGNSLTGIDAGIKWTLVNDSDLQSDIFVTMEMARRFTRAEITSNLLTSGSPWIISQDHSGTYIAMDAITQDDIAPAGISKIEVGTNTYTDNLGSISKGVFKAELLMTEPDTIGKPHGFKIALSVEADALQATNAELIEYSSLDKYQLNVKITFVCGWVLTLTSRLGLEWEWKSDKDADGNSIVHVKAAGNINISEFAALWS